MMKKKKKKIKKKYKYKKKNRKLMNNWNMTKYKRGQVKN